MSKIIDFIQNKFSVTTSEITVVFILLSGLLGGLILSSFYQKDNAYTKVSNEIYASLDSLADVQNQENNDKFNHSIYKSTKNDNIVQSDSNINETKNNSSEKIEESEKSSKIENVNGKINIRTASINKLCVLPGIGEKIAEKIIEYRKEYGITNINDLLNVKGIGPKKFEKIKNMIEVK